MGNRKAISSSLIDSSVQEVIRDSHIKRTEGEEKEEEEEEEEKLHEIHSSLRSTFAIAAQIHGDTQNFAEKRKEKISFCHIKMKFRDEKKRRRDGGEEAC